MSAAPKKLICLDFDETITSINFRNVLMDDGVRSKDTDAGFFRGWLAKNYRAKNTYIRHIDKMRDSLSSIVAKDDVCVAIVSSNNYPALLPVVLENMGLTPNEIGKIKIFTPTPAEKSAKKFLDFGWFKRKTPDALAQAEAEALWTEKLALMKQAMAWADIADTAENRAEQIVLVEDKQSTLYKAKHKGGFKTISATIHHDDSNKYIDEMRAFAGLEPYKGHASQEATPEGRATTKWTKPELEKRTPQDLSPPPRPHFRG